MSGRMLRRLPVLAYARCLVGQTKKKMTSKTRVSANGAVQPIENPMLEPEAWLTALEAVILNETQNRTELS